MLMSFAVNVLPLIAEPVPMEMLPLSVLSETETFDSRRTLPEMDEPDTDADGSTTASAETSLKAANMRRILATIRELCFMNLVFLSKIQFLPYRFECDKASNCSLNRESRGSR